VNTKNDRVMGDQQQFTLPDPSESVLCYIVSRRYLATTGEQTEYSTCSVVLMTYRVCKSVRLLQLFVVTAFSKSSH
jgi:hypothetical protein